MAINEERRAYNRQWQERNREHVRAYNAARREERNARRRELYRQDEWRRKAAVQSAMEYNRKHPLAKRVSKYKVSAEQLELLMNDGCMMCGANALIDTTVKLHVDHDHDTGKFRGILCEHCNLALGHLRNDPIIAMAAFRYLMRSGADND